VKIAPRHAASIVHKGQQVKKGAVIADGRVQQ
jgi:hypothetical protein